MPSALLENICLLNWLYSRLNLNSLIRRIHFDFRQYVSFSRALSPPRGVSYLSISLTASVVTQTEFRPSLASSERFIQAKFSLDVFFLQAEQAVETVKSGGGARPCHMLSNITVRIFRTLNVYRVIYNRKQKYPFFSGHPVCYG